MNRRKKVLILLPSLAGNDGTATSVMNYYDSLIDGKWTVNFMVLKDVPTSAWSKEINNKGSKIYVLPNKNKYSIEVGRKVSEVVKRGNYDIVHINIPGHIALCTLKAAVKNNVSVRIFHCHNPKNTLNLKTKLSTYIYDSLCFKKATHFVACSNTAGKSRYGNKKFEVLKNVIEPSKFCFNKSERKDIRKELKISDDNTVVGVVARISAQKNPDFILECFSEFKKKKKDAKLLWVGDGELLNHIKDIIKNKGLQQDCILVGKKNDIGKWYSAMDLFLLPSIFEGLGIVFLEAQCNGLECFGSDVVPEETEVTNLMHRISLKHDASYWAEMMYSASNLKLSRRSYDKELILAGYTHEATKDNLAKLYTKWISK